MAFIYSLTDSWNDVTTTWNGIKLAVTNTSSDASSKLLNLTVSGATTASFVVDKSGNLELNGSVNKVIITAPATAATFTLADNSTFATVGGYATTFTFSGATSLTFPTSGTVTALGNSTTGSGDIVLATSPTLVSPALGTPSSGTLTNCTGFPASGLTGLGTGVGTWLATPSSANLRAAVTDETGTGSLVFATSPSLVTPDLGTPSAATLTNATGLPVSTGIAGLGSGVATFLETPSSANLAAAVADETGSGSLVFATDPTFPSDVTVGVSSSAQGELVLANTSANTVKLRSSNSTAANYTLTFPAAAPVNGYYLQTDVNGVLSWAAGGGGGGGSPGGSDTQIQFNNAGAFGGDAAFTFVNGTGTATMSLGVASTTSGVLKLYNSASANSVTIASGNNTAAWTMTLPTDDGTNGQLLQTDGSGNLSWFTNTATGDVVGPASSTDNAVVRFDGTTGKLVQNSAVTIADTTGDITGGKYNGLTISTTTGTFTIANGKTLAVDNTLTFVGTDSSTVSFGAGGTVLYSGGALGTPSSGTLTNCSGLPISTGVSGLGTNVATALAVNVGSSGAVVVNGGDLGTPSSGTLTNATGLPISTGVSGLGSNVATFLATPSSANLAAAVTDETGSGALVFATSPTLTTPRLAGSSTGYSSFASANSSATNYTITIPAEDMTVGFRNIPQNSQTGAYVAVAGDNGKHISITTGGVTVNASVFSAGDVFTIYNNSSSNQTITAGSNVTFRLAGTATTGNRTLAQYGVMTLLCVTGGATPTFVVSGGGVT